VSICGSRFPWLVLLSLLLAGSLCAACSGGVSPFGLPNARGSDTLSGSVVVGIPSQAGVTGICSPGTWRPSESLSALGVTIAAKQSDGSQSCPPVRFGDSAYVGLLYTDSLILRQSASVTLAMGATTSGALVNWLLPDINAYLIQVMEPAGQPFRATLVNYVAFARTIEPPVALALDGDGPFAVRVLVVDRIRGGCPVARGSVSLLTIGPLSLSTTVAPPMSASARTIKAMCRP
jgi:hypothetical protein